MNRDGRGWPGTDLDEGFAQRLGISYLLGVLAHQPRMDVDALDLALWLLAEDVPLLVDALQPRLPRKLRWVIREIVGPWRQTRTRALALPLDHEERGDLAVLLGPYLDADAVQGRETSAMPAQDGILVHALRRRRDALARAGIGDLEHGVARFQEQFGLSDDEQALCLFALVTANWSPVRTYFVHVLQALEFCGRRHLRAALGYSAQGLEAVLHGRLRRLGVIPRSALAPLLVEADFLALITRRSSQVADTGLYQPVRPDLAVRPDQPGPTGGPSMETLVLTGASNRAGDHKANLDLARALLARAHDSPTHILITGAPGTGKTALALALARSLPDPAFIINHVDEDEDGDGGVSRWSALTDCLARTSAGPGAILLIDDAGQMLQTGTGFAQAEEPRHAGRLHAFLEHPRVRAVWVVSSLDGIHESVLRRFAFSLHLHPPCRQRRAHLWRHILDRHHVPGITPDHIRQLAAAHAVTPAVMDLAVRQALKG